VAHATKAPLYEIRLPNARLNNAIVNTERRPTAALMPVSATVSKTKARVTAYFSKLRKLPDFFLCRRIFDDGSGFLTQMLL
jgi:hypothetical protein